MKIKRCLLLLSVFLLVIVSAFTAMAASDDVLIKGFNSDYSKNAALETSNGATGTMTGKFEFGGFMDADRAMTTIIGSDVNSVKAEIAWKGKSGGTQSDSDTQSSVATAATYGNLWEATSSATHTATITRSSVSKSRNIIATR